MKRFLNPRIIVWGVILLTLAAVFTFGRTGKQEKAMPEDTHSKSEIVADFITLKNIDVPVKAVLGGTMYAEEIFFPPSFAGKRGDTFFVLFEDGHVSDTVMYRIASDNTAESAEGKYRAVKKMGEEYSPPADYEKRPVPHNSMTGGKP